jgi:hypothetical protein
VLWLIKVPHATFALNHLTTPSPIS